MLNDDGVMNTMNSTGLQRMVRIACACDKAVDALQRIADMSDNDQEQTPGGVRGQGSGGVRGLGVAGGNYIAPPLDGI